MLLFRLARLSLLLLITLLSSVLFAQEPDADAIIESLIQADAAALQQQLPRAEWDQWRDEDNDSLLSWLLYDEPTASVLSFWLEQGMDPLAQGLYGDTTTPEFDYLALFLPILLERGSEAQRNDALSVALRSASTSPSEAQEMIVRLMAKRAPNSIKGIGFNPIASEIEWQYDGDTDAFFAALPSAISTTLQQDLFYPALRYSQGDADPLHDWIADASRAQLRAHQHALFELSTTAANIEDDDNLDTLATLFRRADALNDEDRYWGFRNLLDNYLYASAQWLLENQMDATYAPEAEPSLVEVVWWEIDEESSESLVAVWDAVIDSGDLDIIVDDEHLLRKVLQDEATQSKAKSIITQLIDNKRFQLPLDDQPGMIALLLSNGFTDEAILLIKNSPNASAEDTAIALNGAYENGNFDMVTELLENGAKADNNTYDGATIYHRALTENRIPLLQRWLSISGDIDANDHAGRSLLHTAIAQENHDVSLWLSEQGARIPLNAPAKTSEKNISTFLLAVERAPLALLKDRFATFSAQQKQRPILQTALRGEHASAERFALLLQLGASPEQRDENGLDAANVAIQYNNGDALNQLVALAAEAVATLDKSNPPTAFNDPRLRYWSLLKWSGQHSTLRPLLKSDAMSDQPHPFSAYLWAKSIRESRRTDTLATLQGNEIERLGATMRLQILVDDDDNAATLRDFPPAEAQSLDLFSLLNLFDAAKASHQYALMFSYWETLAARSPNFFQVAWMLPNDVLAMPEYQQKIDALIAQPRISTSLLASWWRSRNVQTWRQQDKIALIHQWLATEPNDPHAHAAYAATLYNSGHRAAAMHASLRTYTLMPFVQPGDLPSESMAYLRDYAGVSRYIARHVIQLDAENAPRDNGRLAIYSRYAVGEYGYAIDTYPDHIARWPSDWRAVSQLAGALENVGKIDEAKRLLQQTLAQPPADNINTSASALHQQLVRLYTDNAQYTQALALQEKQGRGYPLSFSSALALLNAKRETAADDYPERLVRLSDQYPDSVALIKQQLAWQLDRRDLDQASALIERLHQERRLDKTLAQRWLAMQSVAQAKTILAAWQHDAPYHKTYWNLRADEDGEAAWLAATATHPNWYWPTEQLAQFYLQEDREPEALDQLQRFAKQSADATQRHAIHNELLSDIAWATAMVGENHPSALTPHAIEQAFHNTTPMLADYYGQYAYFHTRFRLLRLLGDDDKTTQAVLSLAAAYRGNLNIAWYQIESSNDQKKTLSYYHDLYHRNPYSEDNSKSYLQVSLYYLGRPVLALGVIHRADKEGLAFPQSWREKAYSQLGDSLSGFDSYQTSNYISDSDRYIKWFDAERRKALHGEQMAVHYQLDDGNPSVRIVHPNGEVVKLTVDPVYGQVLRAEKGGAVATLAWTKKGELLRYNVGEQTRLSLRYDDNGEIVSAALGDQRATVRRDARTNEMDWIRLAGTGDIQISYDEDGEIDSVFSAQGYQVSSAVSGFFNRLVSTTRDIGRLQSAEGLFAMEVEDNELAALEEAWQQTESESLEETRASLALGKHFAANAAQHPDYVGRAEQSLTLVFYRLASSDDKHQRRMAFEAIETLHSLYIGSRAEGLPEASYADWLAMRQWLTNQGRAGRKLVAQLDENPLSLLFEQSSLQSATLTNSGHWYRFGMQSIFGDTATDRINAIAAESPSLAYAGTDAGLFVYEYGHWRQYHHQEEQQTMAIGEPSSRSSRNTINALAIDENNQLLVGSAGGFYFTDNELNIQWPSVYLDEKDQGPLHAAVQFIQPNGNNHFLVGAADGLYHFDASAGTDANALTQLYALSDQTIDSAYALPDSAGGTIVISVAGKIQLLKLDDNSVIALADGHSPLWLDDSEELLWLNHEGLQSLSADSLSAVSASGKARDAKPYLLAERALIPHSKRINGLIPMPIYNDATATEQVVAGIMTDQGVALYLGNRIQHFALPYESRRGGQRANVKQGSIEGENLWLNTSDGLYAYLPARVTQLEYDGEQTNTRAHQLLSDPATGITYATTDDGIIAFYPDAPTDAVIFSHTSSTILRFAANGDLISNDGLTVLRFPQGSENAVELFSAEQTPGDESSRYWHGPIRDILAAADGSIWVAAGSSVFHWQNGEVEEFNYLKDNERFPSRSPMMSSVFATQDGTLYVAASDEGHIRHNGVKLTGGLMRWDGSRFENLGAKFSGRMPLSYTALSDNEAVIGTTGAYYRESAGRWSNLRYNDTPSYKALDDVAPMLFLGGRGAQFGDSNTWLFPSAGGVIIRHNDGWFYPDRLNQLLPHDTTLGQYGARTVHAVSVNPNGVVYAGTDLGILIYPAESLAGLMSDHQQTGTLFDASQIVAEQQVRDVILSSLNNNTEAGKLVKRIEVLESEILSLKESDDDNAAAVERRSTAEQGSASDQTSTQNRQQRERLASREKERTRLLAQLEQDHRGLFKTLKLDPREAAALHERFASGQALVQYLPTGEQMAIQVVTKEGARVHLVNVSSSEIYAATERAVATLKASVYKLSRGFGDDSQDNAIDRDAAEENARQEQLQQDLSFLYEVLLRPIERDLVNTRQVFIAPTGKLAPLPFSALLRRSVSGEQFAVERYQLGVVHSLFQLNLVLDESHSQSQHALFIADPDGSLPGARKEVDEIMTLFPRNGQVLRGHSAQLQALTDNTHEARYLHFATHGKMNTRSPADSFLLMADNARLTVSDINFLDLKETDLVVLSACETGIGTVGLEYATLARAFAHAGVPTVIASYWEVSDTATRAIMVRLYQYLVRDGDDSFTALAKAQRDVMRLYPEFKHPAAWAGFTPFGRP